VHQLALDGMPRRLYACTPSRLNTWLDCPRRYRFTYLDRPAPAKGPPWAHNSVGAAVHNALAAWWREPYERRTPEVAGRLVATGWIGDGFRDAEQSARWRERARAMVTAYVGGLDPSAEPVGVERQVATRTDTIAVTGRVDRIDRRGGELVIVDYKTGRRAPDADEARASLALAVYAVAAARTMRLPCRRVELHHLPTGRIAAAEHTAESLDRHMRRAERIAAEAAEADERYREWARTRPGTAGRRGDGAPADVPPELDALFAPRPGPLCSWCDYRRHCPEGQAAAPARRPWDGLAEEEIEAG
jgi:RecB family exonuclease